MWRCFSHVHIFQPLICHSHLCCRLFTFAKQEMSLTKAISAIIDTPRQESVQEAFSLEASRRKQGHYLIGKMNFHINCDIRIHSQTLSKQEHSFITDVVVLLLLVLKENSFSAFLKSKSFPRLKCKCKILSSFRAKFPKKLESCSIVTDMTNLSRLLLSSFIDLKIFQTQIDWSFSVKSTCLKEVFEK